MNPILIAATDKDHSIIQNMARFYIYDRSKYMGWKCPDDGLYECIDFKHYFIDSDKFAYFIKVENELAGFALIDKERIIEQVDFNMGEFFILAKFQGYGIASKIFKEIVRIHSGRWSVAVMPENIKAMRFWHKIIREISNDKFTKIFKTANELNNDYSMEIFHFLTS